MKFYQFFPFITAIISFTMLMCFSFYLFGKKRNKSKVIYIIILFFLGVVYSTLQGFLTLARLRIAISIFHHLKLLILSIGLVFLLEYINRFFNLKLKKIRFVFHILFFIIAILILFTPYILKSEVYFLKLQKSGYIYPLCEKGPLYSIFSILITILLIFLIIEAFYNKFYKSYEGKSTIVLLFIFIFAGFNDFAVVYGLFENLMLSEIAFVAFVVNNSIVLMMQIIKNEEILLIRSKELEKTQKELEDLNDITLWIGSSLNFDEVFQRIFDHLKETYDFEGCTLSLVTHDEKFFVVEKYIVPKHVAEFLNNYKNVKYPLERNFGWLSETIIDNKIIYKTDLNPLEINNPIISRLVEFQRLKTILNIPIVLNDKPIGSFSLGSYSKSLYLEEEDFEGIKRFVYQIAIIIRNMKLIEKLEKLSTHDELTRIYNRRKILEILENEMVRFSRYNHNFAVAILDIDMFKKINDSYGHLYGDYILKELTSFIKNKVLRKTDYIGRYGGEEFLIILPETECDDAIEVCKRILNCMRKKEFNDGKIKSNLTVSLGLTVIRNSDKDIDSLLNRADVALYKAKNNGRNRFEIYSEKTKDGKDKISS